MSNSPFDFSGYAPSAGNNDDMLGSGTDGRDHGVSGGVTWGDSLPVTLQLSQSGPPWVWLWVAVGAALGGVVVGAVLGGSPIGAIVAWVLSGPIAVALFAVYTVFDTRQSAKSFYGHRVEAVWIHRAGLLLALAGVIVASWGIANWVGRW